MKLLSKLKSNLETRHLIKESYDSYNLYAKLIELLKPLNFWDLILH